MGPHARTTYPYKHKGRNGKGVGIGSRLGEKNPKDPCVTGKRKPVRKWLSATNASKKVKLVLLPSLRPTAAELRAEHKAKMKWKAASRGGDNNFAFPQLNRHTGKPHEHKREIARRLRQQKGSN